MLIVNATVKSGVLDNLSLGYSATYQENYVMQQGDIGTQRNSAISLLWLRPIKYPFSKRHANASVDIINTSHAIIITKVANNTSKVTSARNVIYIYTVTKNRNVTI